MQFIKRPTFFFALIFCLTINIFSQQPTRREIIVYVEDIDRQQNRHQLTKLFYPDKTCGGAAEGYFSADKLVFMTALNGGDQLEFRSFYYLKDNFIYKQVEKDYIYNRTNSNPDPKPIKTGKTGVFYSSEPTECEHQMIDGLIEEKNKKRN